MSPSQQAKDLRNGVCPPTALGLMPDLEIGHTRFSALQYRKSNSGFTPDRSLLLKQSCFMHSQRERFFAFFAPAISNGLHLPGRVLHDLAETTTSTQIALANSQAQGYSSFDQERTGRGPAMTSASLVSFGSN